MALLCWSAAMAIPAKPGFKSFKQSDGKINVADVDVLVSYLLNKNTRLIIANAHINANGTYNAADVSALISMIIGN